MWDITINEEKIECCVENLSEYRKIFPQIYETIAEKTMTLLKKECADATFMIGPNSANFLNEVNPNLSKPLYLDWVCFGFEGYRSDQAHLGITFNVLSYPIKYTVGVHIQEFIFPEKGLRIIEERCKEEEPFIFQHDIGATEYKFLDLEQTLNLKNLDSEIARIVDRTEKLYLQYNNIIRR